MAIQLHDHRSIINQRSLKLLNFSIGSLPFRSASEALDPFHENTTVPRAIEDHHLAIGGKLFPKKPKEMVLILFLGRFNDGENPKVTRVQTFYQSSDRAAFAGLVCTFNHHNP